MELTRTYYFDGELLEAEDFIRDQQYFRDITSETNKNLYTPGVVSGLSIGSDSESDPPYYYLSSGLAFDASGLTLLSSEEMALPSLESTQMNGTYWVVLKYSDSLRPTDGSVSDSQAMRSTHIISEIPAIDISQSTTVGADDINGVILGTITVTNGQIAGTAVTGRQTATLTIEAAATTEVAAMAAPSPPVAPPDAERIADALATLDTLSGVAFAAPDGRRRLAVRAREGEVEFPTIELVGLLVEAVKTLAARVETLERQSAPPPATSEG